MDKKELEALLKNESSFADHVHALHQQEGDQVFDEFITALLGLEDEKILLKLLRAYGSCVAGMATSLGLSAPYLDAQSDESTRLSLQANQQYRRALSMEAFLIRFYALHSEITNKKLALDLVEFASLETGEYWLADSDTQAEIGVFLQSCERFLSPQLAKIATEYLAAIEAHEHMQPLKPREQAILLCKVTEGATTYPKGTTGVVIEVLNGPYVSFLVSKKYPQDLDVFLRIDKKYLNLYQTILPSEIFRLTPYESTVVTDLAKNILDGNRDAINFAVQSAVAKCLLEPVLYYALSQDIEKTDKMIRFYLEKADTPDSSRVQDAFQAAVIQFLKDLKKHDAVATQIVLLSKMS